jgi:WD40 repeat protein
VQSDDDAKQAAPTAQQGEAEQPRVEETTLTNAAVDIVGGPPPPFLMRAKAAPRPWQLPRPGPRLIAKAAAVAALIATFGYWLVLAPPAGNRQEASNASVPPKTVSVVPVSNTAATQPAAASPPKSADRVQPDKETAAATSVAKPAVAPPEKVAAPAPKPVAPQTPGAETPLLPKPVVTVPVTAGSAAIPYPSPQATIPDVPPPRPKPDAVAANPLCQPAMAQRPDPMGGPLQLATLKLAAKPQEVRSIAFSPDGARMITAGDDAIIRVWDAASLKWLRDIRGQHTAAVHAIAFSADGSLFASASWDGTVRIWDARTFALMQTFNTDDGSGPVKQHAVAFTPTRTPRYVDSTGDDGNVWIWDLQNPSHFYKWRDNRPAAPARSLSFTPDGSGAMVTASDDGNIRFFTVAREIFALPATTGPQDKLLRVAYSPDGSQVASAGVDTKYQILKIWSAAARTFKAYQGFHNYAASAAWSSDGKLVAVGEGGGHNPSAEIVELQSGVKLKVFSGHTADIEAVAFHPNHKWLVSGSEDGTVKLWDIASANELLTLVGFDNAHLAYAPSGCYTGSANAANYVKYTTKDDQGHEHDAAPGANFFVPGDSAVALLPR